MDILEWVEPDSMCRRDQLRDQALNEFSGPLADVALAVWKDALPSDSVRQEVVRQVHEGLRQAVTALTAQVDAAFLNGTWLYLQGALPPYWEPPVSTVPQSLPEHQIRACRWTASIIALFIRDALEDLHIDYASDDSMPDLNRGLRSKALDLLLTHPAIAWAFSLVPRVCLEMEARGMPVRIPSVTG